MFTIWILLMIGVVFVPLALAERENAWRDVEWSVVVFEPVIEEERDPLYRAVRSGLPLGLPNDHEVTMEICRRLRALCLVVEPARHAAPDPETSPSRPSPRPRNSRPALWLS